MAELSSSQELPLSQETFNNLWIGIPSDVKEQLTNIMNMNAPMEQTEPSEYHDLTELGNAMRGIQIPVIENPQSSVAVMDDSPGYFSFKVSPPVDIERLTKQSPYSYSPITKKLYARIDQYVPFMFSTNQPINSGYVIRANLCFCSPQDATEKVIRCVSHSFRDREAADPLFEHFIRSDSQTSKYYKDSLTKHTSLTVPFENPPSGHSYSTYLFKFKCWTSCYGGPNRRPMCIVFTLETDRGYQVGRCKINLKVCSCPLRDKEAEESRVAGNQESETKEATCTTNVRTSVKRKNESEHEYVVKTKDEECYKLLCAVKKFHQIKKHIPKNCQDWIPTSFDIANLLQYLTSGEDEK